MTTNTKPSHTPAPLTLQELPHHYDFRKGHAYAIRDKRNCCVAVVGEVDAIFDGEETKANATLYAAAPDMLEALRNLEEYFTAYVDADDLGKEYAASARAAIAKAKGGE